MESAGNDTRGIGEMALRAARRMDVKAGDAADAWSADVAFDFASWLVSAECWTNNLDIRLTYDGVNYYDSFEVDPDRPIVFPFEARACQVKNAETDKTSRYQVAVVD